MNSANKLQPGDEIRVIAPSRSAAILSENGIQKAIETLQALGFRVTFGSHVMEEDIQHSSSIASRVEDLHAAFRDNNVKAILTAIGGFNSNELLPYIDFELLRNNPKILCGYSDVTALATAITTQCGFITYSGPHFSSFQMDGLQAYQSQAFMQCMTQQEPYTITPSAQWSDDLWFLDDPVRQYEPTQWRVYTEGSAEGTLFGGNLCTLNLLQGTRYMPTITEPILFIEDDEETNPVTFARDLASLLQAIGPIKGLLIGRFQRVSGVTEEQLHFILQKHPQLKNIPVLYNVDFGHTQPIATLPIGGQVRIDTSSPRIDVLKF